MSWAALTSGGKDSILAICKAIASGKCVSHMVCVIPENPDSYMFHSANLNAVPVMAERAGMQFIGIPTKGEKEDELADLEKGLAALDIEGVIVGAIESEYQRSRVAKICEHLGIEIYAPLWKMNAEEVLSEAAELLEAYIVITAADGLGENVLGKRIDNTLIPVLREAGIKRRIHIAGEGGEYESLVINAPFFSAPLNHSEMNIVCGNTRGRVDIERFW